MVELHVSSLSLLISSERLFLNFNLLTHVQTSTATLYMVSMKKSKIEWSKKTCWAKNFDQKFWSKLMIIFEREKSKKTRKSTKNPQWSPLLIIFRDHFRFFDYFQIWSLKNEHQLWSIYFGRHNPASILPLCLKFLRPAAVGYIEKMCFQTDSHSLKGFSVSINLIRPTRSIKCNNCAYC